MNKRAMWGGRFKSITYSFVVGALMILANCREARSGDWVNVMACVGGAVLLVIGCIELLKGFRGSGSHSTAIPGHPGQT